MENRNLWAPWRSQYVGGAREPGCVFCLAAANPGDDEKLVAGGGAHAFVMLNRFPYTSGHAMIAPRRHVADVSLLDNAESAEIWKLAVEVKRALAAIYKPDGFNIGMNLGQAAGAGIADHLHLHVVPRWIGDSNFMPVLGDVRVISTHLSDTLGALRQELGLPLAP